LRVWDLDVGRPEEIVDAGGAAVGGARVLVPPPVPVRVQQVSQLLELPRVGHHVQVAWGPGGRGAKGGRRTHAHREWGCLGGIKTGGS